LFKRIEYPTITIEDVLVCDLVLMALLTLLFLSLSTERVVFFVLSVLAVFGLNATLIFSLIIIIVIHTCTSLSYTCIFSFVKLQFMWTDSSSHAGDD